MSAKIDPVSKIGVWMSFVLFDVFVFAGDFLSDDDDDD